VLIAALTALSACSDSDDPTDLSDGGVTVEDFVGSWTASSHVYTNNADASETFDLIANGGETRTTILTGGRGRTWVEFGTFSDEWDAQLSISGNTVTSVPAEASRETRVWTFTLVGTVITLTDESSSFDFTLMEGPGVSATEVVVFVKQ
jgi:hypothetical protein